MAGITATRVVLLAALATVLAGCASGPSSVRGTEIRIRYAQIVRVDRTDLPSMAPAGAMVGGFTGLMLSRRSRPGSQLASGVGGAVLGGLATRALEGDRRGYSYRLRFFDGSESDFITEKGYLRAGDCVSVESGTYQNLRRVASAVCESAPTIREPYQMHQDNAALCQQAKQELLLAQGPDAINDAARKVEVLCQF